MYKTPTFAELQQCNRPFSTGQLSAFIIQLVVSDDIGHSSMLASVELKKRKNRDDLDFLQMNATG
jgi:hypothetical protein